MNAQEAARSVLIEVVNILGAFKKDIVIVGGWVPDLTYPNKKHVGSLDVDLAIGPGAIGDDAYSSILARLKENDYSHTTHPTRFHRNVPGVADPIKVDLITGEYVTAQKAETIQIDELSINCLRGIDLAFEACNEIFIEGTMPDGSRNIVRAQVVRPEAFILIKAFAMAERKKEKDAYDIAFVLNHYNPSLAVLANRMAVMVKSGLGAQAFQILVAKFATLQSVGPTWAAKVAEENGLDREQTQQAAFQDMQELFKEIRYNQ